MLRGVLRRGLGGMVRARKRRGNRQSPRSFSEGKRPYYITTPIFYVNDKPHIGHAYTSVVCDALARYQRMRGREVVFATGTDEHGLKVQQSAERAGLSPQAFADGVSAEFREMGDEIGTSDSQFVRTTEPRHAASAQALWRALHERGQIYLGSYQGWYSVRDEAYYKDAEIVDGKAPTGSEVTWVDKEESYFFRLSEWQQPLLDLYASRPDFVLPEGRQSEVVNFVEEGLLDLSISRTSFDWGVPVPADACDPGAKEEHVMYVWVDALASYLTAAGYPDGPDWSRHWPCDLHVIGKDILRFHAIYWPAMLMAAGIDPPAQILAHGWWLRDGEKMSKSVGNVVDPRMLTSHYGVDQTRYLLAAGVKLGGDGDFSYDLMDKVSNGILANAVGNLVQRVAGLAGKKLDCKLKVPDPSAVESSDESVLAQAMQLGELCASDMDAFRMREYCERVHLFVKDVNKYINEQEPWKIKDDPDRVNVVLWVTAESIRRAATLLYPVIPQGSDRIFECLGRERHDFDALIRDAETEDVSTLLGRSQGFELKPLDKGAAIFPKVSPPEE